MVNSMQMRSVLFFPNSYDNLVPELAGDRLMASIPFAGRYRIIDFLLSSSQTAGSAILPSWSGENYHSLMDHLGSGRAWDLLRKTEASVFFRPMRRKI